MRFVWPARVTLLAVGLTLNVVGTACAEDDDAIAVSKVPAVARRAAEQAAPQVRFSKAYKDVDEGKTFYELVGVNPQGREVTVEVTARGVVRQVGTQVATGEIPAVVLDTLRAKTRGVKFTHAAAVTKEGRLFAYEFEGENTEGDDVVATIAPDGRVIEIDVDDED